MWFMLQFIPKDLPTFSDFKVSATESFIAVSKALHLVEQKTVNTGGRTYLKNWVFYLYGNSFFEPLSHHILKLQSLSKADFF